LVTSFDVSHGVLVLIGAFYTFAGLVGLKMAVSGRLMDVAIAAISLQPTPRAEIARGVWLLVSSILVLAGGLFLILRTEWAAWAFVASAAGQAIYLLLVAPVFLDKDDPPDATGRQQTINAFILYAAATAFVLWAYRTGRLLPAEAVGWPAIYGALAVLGAAATWGTYRFAYPMAKSPLSFLRRDTASPVTGEDGIVPDDEPEEETGPPLSESRRILVMSDYECDPLWTHDPGRSGTFSPRELPLSEALIADLEVWAASYDTSFNHEDYSQPHWSEAQYQAHYAEGVALARRLKQELPDRQIFVWRSADGSIGHVEITADD
jgi:hypothetical protein